MDRAVLSADSWSDLEVPPFCPLTPADQKALESFQDQVIDRLFLLNAARAQEEARLGTPAKKSAAKPKSPKKPKPTPPPDQGRFLLMSDTTAASPDPNELAEHCAPACGKLQAELGQGGPIDDIGRLWEVGHRLAEHRRNLYRGETSAKHRLHSTLDRQTHLPVRAPCSDGPTALTVEALVFRSFQRHAHHHLSIEELPQGDDPMEWLAVMRHYGAPTRLLDWSYSFWVALFFAAAGARSEPAAVWVVDDEWAQAVATDALRKKTNGALAMHERDLHCQAQETFNHVYVQESEGNPFVQKQNAWRRNARLVAQQGCFLCPGDVTHCFQSNLAAMRQHPATAGRNPIQRIDFSQTLIPDVLNRLDSYGVNYATMYPDLEGIGKDLSLLPLVKRLHASELRLDGIGGLPPRRKGEM